MKFLFVYKPFCSFKTLYTLMKMLDIYFALKVLTSRATSRRSAINFRQPTPRKSINSKDDKNLQVKKPSSKYSVREADLETQFRSITEILKLLKLKYKWEDILFLNSTYKILILVLNLKFFYEFNFITTIKYSKLNLS